MMYIKFINSKIRKLCEDHSFAIKKLGKRNADLLFQRLSEIRASNNLKVFMSLPNARCHSLKHDRRGQYATDLVHPKRLILLPTTSNGEIITNLVDEITVIEIVNYH